MHGVRFESIDPDAIGELHGERPGVLAQELERTFPDRVIEGDDGYKRVTFRGFEGVAIEALRELNAEADSLRTTVAAQRGEIHDLRERIARLESWVERTGRSGG